MNFVYEYEQCCETGELWPLFHFNDETGELEAVVCKKCPQRPFKIPKHLQTNTKDDNAAPLKQTNYYSNNMDVVTAFLLPTAILFFPSLAVLMWLFEYILHAWSHKQNSKNGNTYYFSPLHQICKEFCSKCKEETMRAKISKMQDMRNCKLKKYGLEYVRRIVT